MASPLSLYEPLDIIGNGSFGIIRKVRRKSDGLIFARKELNFERMTERDRKQIVAEVNILKDLHHEHIVRYHDRYVDREAGILYILMEYCGGGDLSNIIKQAQRHARPIPEDTIWNYFMQLLLALNHCHHPQHGGRPSSGGSGSSADEKERDKRPQILHRDLKPDNVFLDENNTVKLGDFGLSKALAQASFANTYVGTPYYMSPELMQEKAYDSKSDIWSLGCLIYELCALKPPFHEAKTHAELSILIRNGRIPPLPKGYSPALSQVIKAMLNLNPAMRPSAQHLLQHERLDLAFKVAETQKMLTTVKSHKATVVAREREVAAREALLVERESQMAALLAEKDTEVVSLRALLSTAEATHQAKVREALIKREEELRAMVLKQEAEVAARMARREEEIMEAVRKREEDIARMWADWERDTREGMVRAVEERMAWVQEKGDELEREKAQMDEVRRELERRLEQAEARTALGSSKTKHPLEEVKNIMARATAEPTAFDDVHQTPVRTSKSSKPPVFETPIKENNAPPEFPSAMKGVVLTATGETLATPTPTEFAKLFIATPKVSLDFAQIFDFSACEEGDSSVDSEGYETDTRPPMLSATVRGVERPYPLPTEEDLLATPKQNTTARPTRLRRPSIRANSQRPLLEAPALIEPSAASSSSSSHSNPIPTSHSVSTLRKAPSRSSVRPPSRAGSSASRPPSRAGPSASRPPSSAGTSSAVHLRASPAEYDLSDEENLPSPFLKRTDRDRISRTMSVPANVLSARGAPSSASAPPAHTTRSRTAAAKKSSHQLRALAVVNAANAAGHVPSSKSAGTVSRLAAGRTQSASAVHVNGGRGASIARAQRASEDMRRVLPRAS